MSRTRVSRRSAGWSGRRRGRAQAALSWILVLAMTLPLCGVTAVFAAEPGLCEHHPEHTPECGYIEAVEAAPCRHVHNELCRFPAQPGDVCSHVHDEACGYVEAKAEIPCDKNCASLGAEGVLNGTDETGVPDGTDDAAAPDGTHLIDNPGVPAADAPVVHAPDCAYRPAVEGHPCGHVHNSAECGFQPGPDAVCGHVHSEECGYREAVEGHPCGFVCEICNPAPAETKNILSWEWDAGDEECLANWDESRGSYVLALPGAGPETPVTRDVLPDLLPPAVRVQLEDGNQESLTLTWDLSVIPEAGTYEGEYTLTPALPEGYALAEGARSMAVRLELGGANTLAVYDRLALNDWVWEGLGKQGRNAVICVDTTNVQTTAQLVEELMKILPQRIYGSSYGSTKVTNDGPYTYSGIYDTTVSPARTYGYLAVDWSKLENQITAIGWTPDSDSAFVVEADKPTWPGTTYYINNVWDTDETQTMPITIQPISLKNPKYIVTPANPANTTVNLFDYWVEDYGKNPTAPQGDILKKSDIHFHEDGGNGALSTTSTGYSSKNDWYKGINDGHLLLFGDGPIHAGLWNKGAGQNCRYGKNYAGMEGIVKNVLPENGYPELNLGMAKEILNGVNDRNSEDYRDYTLVKDYKLTGDHDPSGGEGYTSTDIQNLSKTVIEAWNKDPDNDKESLNYLFDPAVSHKGKTSYSDVTGLFQLDDEGYYYYSMRENFAEFDEDSNSFILYNAPATTRTDGTNSIGNFLPFNKGGEVFNGLDSSGKLTSSVEPNNNTMNHHLGMTVEVNFRQPTDGKINTGSKLVPMTFQFSGDDDVWVFIDDVLVLDLGGIHSELYGTINFENGEVLIGRSFDTNGIPSDPTDSRYCVTSTNLKELFDKAGMLDAGEWRGNTFASDTNHTLKMFYLERGNYDSSLALRFNLQPQLFQSIKKVDQDGKPMDGVEFKLYKAEPTNAADPGAIQCLYTDKEVPEQTGRTPFYMKRTGEALTTIVTGGGDGTAQFVDKDTGEPFNFADLAKQGTQYFVLQESVPPSGYRALPVDVVLYYDEDYSMLSVANRWSTGAYACSTSHVTGTGRLTYGVFNPDTGNIDSTQGMPVNSAYQRDGLVVAIPMLKKHSNGTWSALYGSNLQGFHSVPVDLTGAGSDDEAKKQLWRTAALEAALEQIKNGGTQWYLSWDEENNRLTGTLSDLPGLASRYQLNNPDGDMRMVYGIIEAEALAALNIREGNAVSRFQALQSYLRDHTPKDTAAAIMGVHVDYNASQAGFSFLNTSQFNRNFRSLIYIPNEQRELWVMKVDQNGNPKSGAKFGLFTDKGCSGSPAAQGVTDSNGRLVFSPSADSSKQGYAKMEWASAEHVRYYLKETAAPAGMTLNNTVIPVVVGTYSIYADACEDGDGVSVMAGVGRLTQTMRQYASDGEVDITLRDITAYGQSQPSTNTNVSPKDWEDMPLRSTVGGQVLRSINLHYKMNALVDYGLHDIDGGKIYKPFFVTDTGFIRARVEQNYDALTEENTQYNPVNTDSNKDDLRGIDLTGLFSLLNVVVVTDQDPNAPAAGELLISKEIVGDASPGDYTKNFTFTLTLTGPDGQPLTGKYHFWGTDKAGEIGNGDVFVLHHDEEIVIQGLPVGTEYTVTETQEDGWHAEQEQGTFTGSIEKDGTAKAKFRNSKDPFEPTPKTGSLTITKSVTGTAGDPSKDFTFTVELTPPGGASRRETFTLKHGQSRTFSDLPAGTAYKVTESDAPGYQVTSSNAEGTIPPSGGSVTAAFTNHKDKPDNPPPDNPPPDNPPPDNPPPDNPPPDNPPPDNPPPDNPPPDNPPPDNPPPDNPPPDNPPPDNPPPDNPPPDNPPPDYPTELPDPNDPDAPDTITILEDGVPTTYVRVWDPEKEEWVWIPEDDVPLGTQDLPRTGDSGLALWAALSMLSLAGLGTLNGSPLPRKKRR